MVAVLLPVAGILASFVGGGRAAARIMLLAAPLVIVIAGAIAIQIGYSGQPLVYTVAAIPPPLGIALRADGLSAIMMLTTAAIMPAAALYARAAFEPPNGISDSRESLTFWIMLQAIQAALTLIFVGSDMFNLYVALELLTFAAVPLVCIDGRAETMTAALRYLLFALAGSICYLLGTALLYGEFGTLDMALLAQRMRPAPAVWLASGLMTAGLLAKTALLPLHLWLPPAHANAPAAASAVLSGLVVKGSFFIILRLWFDILPILPAQSVDVVLGLLGSTAVIVGSALALRQARLKLLIAYSTVAQIGYLFLVFPLASGANAGASLGWRGGIMQILAHAFAKAAMFLSAGVLAQALGHDRIAKFEGAGRALPLTFFTLALAGLSLVGLPPSGGFSAKWLMLQAAIASGQWLWSIPILAGGVMAAGYMFRILTPAFADGTAAIVNSPDRTQGAVALGLALVAIALGFVPPAFFDFLEIGRTAAALVAK